MIEILLVFALAIGLAWPLGLYLARIMRGTPMYGDEEVLRVDGTSLMRERRADDRAATSQSGCGVNQSEPVGAAPGRLWMPARRCLMAVARVGASLVRLSRITQARWQSPLVTARSACS